MMNCCTDDKNAIKIAVCDDEQACIDDVCSLLKKYFPEDAAYAVSCYSSGEELIKAMEVQPADILFMDIELAKLNGIDTVRQIKKIYRGCIVFFVTAHTSYITEIFRLGSFQFLKKPINEEDFAKDIKRAVQLYRRIHSKLEVRTEGAVRHVSIGDIVYIEVYRKQVKLVLRDGEIEHYGNISAYEKRLSGYGFAKSHKSFLVNLRCVGGVEGDEIIMSDGAGRIPLSRSFRQSFITELTKSNAGKLL